MPRRKSPSVRVPNNFLVSSTTSKHFSAVLSKVFMAWRMVISGWMVMFFINRRTLSLSLSVLVDASEQP